MKHEPKASQSLPSADVKVLARLVQKHGPNLIAAAAYDVPLPKKGRPTYTGRHSPRELADLAKWLDERKRMHEQNRTRAPAYAALIDRYWFEFGKQADPQRSDKFAKTTKKLWAKGRRIREQRRARLARR